MVAPSPIHGWGLVATRRIRAGAIADEAPVLLTRQRVPRAFEGHVYRLPDGRSALPCGDGIFTNHADDPNAEPKIDFRRRVLVLVAVRDIAAGEEVTFDYGTTVTPFDGR